MARRKRTSRKRKRVLQDIEKPWCFYCDRSFEDEQVLHSHQRARHFSCPHCTRKFALALSLGMHMYQTHQDPLHEVHNSIPGRGNPKIPISGMNGIPVRFQLERYRAMYREENRDEISRMEIARKITELGGNVENLMEEVQEKEEQQQKEQEQKEEQRNEAAAAAAQTQQPSLKQRPFIQGTFLKKQVAAAAASNQRTQIYVFEDKDLSMEEKRAEFYAKGGVEPAMAKEKSTTGETENPDQNESSTTAGASTPNENQEEPTGANKDDTASS